MPQTQQQNNENKPFSPDEVTVTNYFKSAGEKSRQYSAFMAFRCILSPNFRFKYGDASIFFGKLWAKKTPTLKTEMTRIGNIVKSKMKENCLVFKPYVRNGQSSTNNDVANINTDANRITARDVFITDPESSNEVNTHVDYNGDMYAPFDPIDPASYLIPNNMYSPAVGTYSSLSYDDGTIIGNVAGVHDLDAIYV
ncbi:1946_t:CDS:2, partial [Paraglomus occultum]